MADLFIGYAVRLSIKDLRIEFWLIGMRISSNDEKKKERKLYVLYIVAGDRNFNYIKL